MTDNDIGKWFTVVMELRGDISEMEGRIEALATHEHVSERLLAHQRDTLSRIKDAEHAAFEAARTAMQQLSDRVDAMAEGLSATVEQVINDRVDARVDRRIEEDEKHRERARIEIEARVRDNTRALRSFLLTGGGVIGVGLAVIVMVILKALGVELF